MSYLVPLHASATPRVCSGSRVTLPTRATSHPMRLNTQAAARAAKCCIGIVMAAQADLVEPLATLAPRIVKMAPAGERPED